MFIYNGETNVRQSDFESFLHTAETLQIEGLSSSSQYNEVTFWEYNSQNIELNMQPIIKKKYYPGKAIRKGIRFLIRGNPGQ